MRHESEVILRRAKALSNLLTGVVVVSIAAAVAMILYLVLR